MLIVIPTYKRNAPLRLVLQSLVQSDLALVDEPIRVLVVNNYPPAAKEIENIVNDFTVIKKFNWSILHREKTLDPIDNFYSAILANACEGETVFLHGDDDIFYPKSIGERYQALLSFSADMLISWWDSRLIFDNDNGTVLLDLGVMDEHLEKKELVTKEVLLNNLAPYSPVFISTHVYRNNAIWRGALKRAFSWCEAQTWTDSKNTLMLPLYLPIAVILNGGVVSGMNKACVIRGGSRDELIGSKFGVTGWNSGYIALLAYQVLNNRDLANEEKLDIERVQLRKMAIQWFFTYWFDASLSKREVISSLRHAKLNIGVNDFIDLIYGLRLLVGEWFFIRRLKMIIRFKYKKGMTATEFISHMNEND